MTIDQMIARLQELKAQGVPGSADVYINQHPACWDETPATVVVPVVVGEAGANRALFDVDLANRNCSRPLAVEIADMI